MACKGVRVGHGATPRDTLFITLILPHGFYINECIANVGIMLNSSNVSNICVKVYVAGLVCNISDVLLLIFLRFVVVLGEGASFRDLVIGFVIKGGYLFCFLSGYLFYVFLFLSVIMVDGGDDPKKKGKEGVVECNALWRKCDALIDLHDCTCAASQKVKDHGQLLRLMQFLMGLDDMYNSVRSLILTTEPLHDLRSAFATLSRDESHRNSGSSSKSVKTGPTAFVSRPSNGNKRNTNKTSNNDNNNFGSNRRFGKMSNLVCKHCNMTGHTIERCFELVGYPPGFKRNNC
ncbi:hypothetical protein Tco_0923426 [Tanacetum coccineum]|uniref:Uncharacterized protein n=1 Tax=Tanacetum coccineum TaxID=301880 RepID=A0ABQ5D2G8_9ASTR